MTDWNVYGVCLIKKALIELLEVVIELRELSRQYPSLDLCESCKENPRFIGNKLDRVIRQAKRVLSKTS